MPTIIKNITHIYRNLTLVLLVSIMALTACSSDVAGGDDPPAPAISARNLARSTKNYNGFTPDNYRIHFVVFSIETSSDSAGEYRIGARKTSVTAPTAQELTNSTATITRTLGTSAINIYLPTDMDSTYFDPGTTKNYANALAAMLTPNTSYTIYASKSDGTGDVHTLLSITTDARPATVLAATEFYGVPTGYDYTVGSEVVLVPVFYGSDGVEWLNSGANVTTCSGKTASCFPATTGYYPAVGATILEYNPIDGGTSHVVKGVSTGFLLSFTFNKIQ